MSGMLCLNIFMIQKKNSYINSVFLQLRKPNER